MCVPFYVYAIELFVNYYYFLQLQLDCTKKYIFAELSNALSPTTVEAFNKLNKTIINYVSIKLS